MRRASAVPHCLRAAPVCATRRPGTASEGRATSGPSSLRTSSTSADTSLTAPASLPWVPRVSPTHRRAAPPPYPADRHAGEEQHQTDPRGPRLPAGGEEDQHSHCCGEEHPGPVAEDDPDARPQETPPDRRLPHPQWPAQWWRAPRGVRSPLGMRLPVRWRSRPVRGRVEAHVHPLRVPRRRGRRHAICRRDEAGSSLRAMPRVHEPQPCAPRSLVTPQPLRLEAGTR